MPLRRLAIAPGAHVVELSHPDYRVLRRVVTARSGETVTLTVDLPE
ncbi:MAG: PEGA domain-containing protein [Vicinamibacteria bacterium]